MRSGFGSRFASSALALLLLAGAARAQLTCPGNPPLRIDKGPYRTHGFELTSEEVDAWLTQVRTTCTWGATADPFAQYALLAGRSGGQMLVGSNDPEEFLTLRSASGGLYESLTLGNGAIGANVGSIGGGASLFMDTDFSLGGATVNLTASDVMILSYGTGTNSAIWFDTRGTDAACSSGAYRLWVNTASTSGHRFRLCDNGTTSSIVTESTGDARYAPISVNGTVTSVALTVPSWLTVGGSPVTTAGTLAITATSGQTANQFLATPNGATGAVSLRAIVAADVPTLNQDTTGTAGDVTCTGCLGSTEIAALDAGDTTTGTFADARVDGSLEADEVNPTLGTQTQGNYVASVASGAGLSGGAAGSEGAALTLATDSTEADFLASGALTCGAATQGKIKVHTTPLQYCDNAATPTLQYAAYGNSSGVATSATALAANGSNCSAGAAAGGTSAAGAAEDCTTYAQIAGDLGNTGASPQVTATHLSAALPVAQGGTATTSTLSGLVNGGNPMTGSLLTGAATDALATPALALGTDPDTGVSWVAGANIMSLIAGSKEALRVNTATNAINYLSVTPAASGSPVQVSAIGTNADLVLAPSASGRIVSIRESPGSGNNGTITSALYNFSSAVRDTGNFLQLAGTGLFLGSGRRISWQSNDSYNGGDDTGLSRISAGVVGAGTGAQGSTAGDLRAAIHSTAGTNGFAKSCTYNTELLTLSTAGATTDTTANLFPANSQTDAITYRITTTITTATAFTIKIKGGNSYCSIGTATTSQSTLTSGTTGVLVPCAHADAYAASASKATVDTTGTPGAGVIRLTTSTCAFTAPTS
jgi:hypothetical protein